MVHWRALNNLHFFTNPPLNQADKHPMGLGEENKTVIGDGNSEDCI